MRKTKAVRVMLKAALILALAAFLGAALMVFAYKVPVVDENYETSMDFLYQQGMYPVYPLLSESRQWNFMFFSPGVFEGMTVKCELNLSFDNSEQGAFEKAMIPSYVRYWHGYVSLLRPLLYFWDYEKIQMLNCFLQLMLLIYISALIGKLFPRRYCLLFATTAVLLYYPVVAICFQYTWVCWIAFGAVAAYLSHPDFFEKKERLLIFFLILGIVTNYFDLLTYPLFTWGLPIIWIILYRKEAEWTDHLKNVILTAISWIVGYAGMWVSKWCIASVILHENVFQNAMGEAGVWTGGTAYRLFHTWIAVSRNWMHYQYFWYALLLFAWLTAGLILWLIRGMKKDGRVIALFLVSCSSLVWYFVMYYHVYIHHVFTYRVLSVAVTALISIFTVSSKWSKDSPVFCREGFLRRLIGVLLIVFLAFGLERISYEETVVSNYALPVFNGERTVFSEAVVMEFYPERSYVSEFQFVVYPAYEGQGTDILVTVRDESGEIRYQEAAAPSVPGDLICKADVKWKLRPGERYLVEIQPADWSDPPLYNLSDEEALPVGGVCYLNEDGGKTNVQPAMGIRYFGRAFPRRIKLFYLCTWMGVLYAVGCVLFQLPLRRGKNR